MPSIVHVVDDDLAVRQSLAFLLASDGLPVRLHASADAFLANVAEPPEGCIVTDVRMPGTDGIEFLRRLKAKGFSAPVIVMTGHADVPLAVEAMKEGAIDFVEKPFSDDQFLAIIRRALERREQASASDERAAAFRVRIASLSARERQVLQGLVAGKPNKVIADDLGLSHRTVEIHRAHLMAKVQAASFSELVRIAFYSGITRNAAEC